MLFLPIPKAACTSVTVHDTNAWAPDHRFAHSEDQACERVLREDGWLRFTVVRDPWQRLWSAWLSKLLLREPRFVALCGEQPWFPREPERAADVIEDFRRFVAAARRNASPLALPPHADDEAAAAVVRRRFGADLEAFGYADGPPAAGSSADWEARLGPARSPVAGNLEGEADFDVRWGWADGPARPGMTAVVRVRNEARALPWTLPPLLRAVDRVVVVDNGSSDGTARVARELGAHQVVSYPFAVARCGSEHLATPERSVHSLAYFYNWSFAHVRTTYALKWDGDMVLSELAVRALRDLAWQLESTEMVVRVPRLGLYVADERLAYLDTGLRNCEAWAWPNRPGYRFVKALEWELPLFPPGIATLTLPELSCVELKFLADDEFSHWSPTDFEASPRTARKQREQAVFHALAAGEPPPEGVVAIEAPAGTHVIDHVRRTWLAAAGGSGARRFVASGA